MRRRRNDTLAMLALTGAILVSVLAFPFGRLHADACAVARHVSGIADLRCGMGALRIRIDTTRTPFVAIALHLL